MNYAYIDTRIGKSVFSIISENDDYKSWIEKQYNASNFKDGNNTCLYGLAQKIHEIIQAKNPPKVFTIGPGASIAATFIKSKADKLGKTLSVEVIHGCE